MGVFPASASARFQLVPSGLGQHASVTSTKEIRMPLLRIRGRLGGRGARRAMLVTGVVSALVIGLSVGVYAAAAPSGTGAGGCLCPAAAPYPAIPNDGQADAPQRPAAIDA